MMDLMNAVRFSGNIASSALQSSRAAQGTAFQDLMARESQGQEAQAQTETQPADRELTSIGWSEAMAGKTGDIIVPKDEEDRALMNAWFADYLERNPGPSPEDYEPLPNLSDVLSGEEWKELADKYNPSCMTQKEYDSFLEDLVEMGALHTSDLEDLGHSEYAPKWVKITAAMLRPKIANGAELPPGGSVPTFTNGARYVNVLYWAQEEKNWLYYDEEQSNWVRDHKEQAFQQVYDVLQQMRFMG